MTSARVLSRDGKRNWRARPGISLTNVVCIAALGLGCEDATIELFAPPSTGGTSPSHGSGGASGMVGTEYPAIGGAVVGSDGSAGTHDPSRGGDRGDDDPFATGGSSDLDPESLTCAGDNQCPEGLICTADCGGAVYCPDSIGVCVPKCVSDENCHRDERCALATGRCVECLTLGDCGAQFVACRAYDGRCVECEHPEQCPEDRPFCEVYGGECVECGQPMDCPVEKPICNSGGRCIQCTDSFPVFCTPEAPVCSEGYCVECSISDHCHGDRPYCDDFRCVQCSEHFECELGYCNLDTNLCNP